MAGAKKAREKAAKTLPTVRNQGLVAWKKRVNAVAGTRRKSAAAGRTHLGVRARMAGEAQRRERIDAKVERYVGEGNVGRCA